MSDEIKIEEVLGKNKHQQVFIGAAILLVLLGLLYIIFFRARPEPVPEPFPGISNDEVINKQIEEMEQANKNVGIKPLTNNEIDSQIKEMEKVNENMGIKPLTDEEIGRQIKEMEELNKQVLHL